MQEPFPKDGRLNFWYGSVPNGQVNLHRDLSRERSQPIRRSCPGPGKSSLEAVSTAWSSGWAVSSSRLPQVSCKPGYYNPDLGGRCHPCPIGKFQVAWPEQSDRFPVDDVNRHYRFARTIRATMEEQPVTIAGQIFSPLKKRLRHAPLHLQPRWASTSRRRQPPPPTASFRSAPSVSWRPAVTCRPLELCWDARTSPPCRPPP